MCTEYLRTYQTQYLHSSASQLRSDRARIGHTKIALRVILDILPFNNSILWYLLYCRLLRLRYKFKLFSSWCLSNPNFRPSLLYHRTSEAERLTYYSYSLSDMVRCLFIRSDCPLPPFLSFVHLQVGSASLPPRKPWRSVQWWEIRYIKLMLSGHNALTTHPLYNHNLE